MPIDWSEEIGSDDPVKSSHFKEIREEVDRVDDNKCDGHYTDENTDENGTYYDGEDNTDRWNHDSTVYSGEDGTYESGYDSDVEDGHYPFYDSGDRIDADEPHYTDFDGTYNGTN